MGAVKEDMPVSEFRANVTNALDHVRLLRWTIFLTTRGKPTAAVVPPGLGKLVRLAGGADEAARILARHLGVNIQGDQVVE